MSVDYCGVVEHDDDCLCDVVIPHPTGWVDCAIQDMWMGQEIVNMMGYPQEWDDDSILSYLCDLCLAKDHWSAKILESSDRSAIPELRSQLQRRLQSGETKSILDVANSMGIHANELLYILFVDSRKMTIDELRMFEDDVVNKRFYGPYGLAKKYNLNCRNVGKVHALWGVPFASKDDLRSQENVLIDNMILDNPELSNKEIAIRVSKELGLDKRISTDSVRARRRRIKPLTVNAQKVHHTP